MCSFQIELHLKLHKKDDYVKSRNDNILLFFHTVYDRNGRVKRATKRKFREMIVQLNPVLEMGFLTNGLPVTRQAGNVCITQH
jgi:hypothetical protein